MGILDSLRKSKEAPATNNTPTSRRETLAEILQDKNKNHLFGNLLKQSGHEELATRLLTGKLNEDDVTLLEDERQHFTEVLERSEKVEALITEENIAEFANSHPEFEKIVRLVGPEKAAKIIKGQLKEIAFTDAAGADNFERIARSLEIFDSYKNGDYKTLNDNVEKMCKDGKFTPEEYLEAIAIQDPVEKQKALNALAKRQYGIFRRAYNHLQGIDTQNLRDLEVVGTLSEDAVAEFNRYQTNIGNTLFQSINENEDLRNALSRELIGEKTPTEKKDGFKEVKEEAKKGNFDEDKFNADWETYKTKRNFSSADSRQQNAIKNQFLADQVKTRKEANKGKQGFWASILSSMAEEMIKGKKNTLN